ncbi:MAG: glycosyltransferase family 4 protein, partial [Bacteroidaceae bacterium]|nr:glycosyltransferase family 4 protein [Bacteroidaceae bacterium]
MKIGFDAKRAAQNRTGLGNYSRFVLNILSNHYPENEYTLFIPNKRKTACLKDLKDLGKFSIVSPISKIFKSLWRVWGISNDIDKSGVDIYHGLSNELPLSIKKTGCKSIVTIHDLIFLHYPQYYHSIDRWIYKYKFRKACENADKIIAVSEFTKQEIIRYFGTPEDKITVVYQGCDAQFRQPATEQKKQEVRQRYNLPQHYILYVGTIEERKNLMLLAKALLHLPKDVKVAAFGKATKYTQQVKDYLAQNNLTDRVLFVHQSDFHDLPAIYQQADIFVYPSRIEGFGIPLLEALCSGVPAIGCTGSCLEEAGGTSS